MNKSGEIQISARYVSALYEIAGENSALSDVEHDFALLFEKINSVELKKIINNPLISRSQQAEIINSIARNLNLHKITGLFLQVLAKARRLALLPEIAKQFAIKSATARGEISVDLLTSIKISVAEAKNIADSLGKTLKKNVLLNDKHDEKLLGGAILKIGNTCVDASLAGKLSRMEQKLKAA